MDQKSAEALSNHDLLVHVAVEVGIVKDRTEGMPELRQRLTKVENDMGWVKKAFWGWAVPSTLALIGFMVKVIR